MAYLKLHRALTHFDTEKRQHILRCAIWLASVVVVLGLMQESDKLHRQNEPCCSRRGNALCILRTLRENGRG